MTTQIGVLDSYLSQNDKKISLYRIVSFILNRKIDSYISQNDKKMLDKVWLQPSIRLYKVNSHDTLNLLNQVSYCVLHMTGHMLSFY